jgi:hypothetical protein
MSRKFAAAFIAVYLAVLGYGLTAHTIGYRTYQNLGMYFIVWDMYCGWNGWETRHHLLAEGESGTYYDMGQGPWGDISVFGDIGRRHYDSGGTHAMRLAKNVANHTDHEPLVRYLLVEEAWAKKYNLPDELWAKRLEEPKEFHSYHRIRAAYDSNGELMIGHPGWLSWLAAASISNNPRLRQDVQKGAAHITTDAFARAPEVLVPVGYESYAPGSQK